jgi:hypothetical protein
MANTIITKNSATATAVPTAGQLVQGELAVNVTDKRLFTENSGGTVVELGTNPSQVNFADNAKAIFGAGSDLQIYHDGTHSIIKDAGVGFLKIGLSDQGTAIQNTAGNNLLVTSATDVSLRYDGSEKLATTATGIDVTGTVVADGLTVDGNSTISGTSPQLFFQTGASHYNWHLAAQENVSGAFEISSGNIDAVASDDTYTKRLIVNNNGDISFYEDTGTTAKFFWDASAESLGIGTSSPATQLEISGSVLNPASPTPIELRLSSTNNASNWSTTTPWARLSFWSGDASTSGPKLEAAVSVVKGGAGGGFSNLTFSVDDGAGTLTEAMRVSTDGYVGIGTTAPGAPLNVSVDGSGPQGVARFEAKDGATTHFLSVVVDDTANIVELRSTGTSGGGYTFYSGNNERIRFPAAGGITFNGDTDAASTLDDYEEGSWTPVVADATTAGNVATASVNYAKYTKIGNVVTLAARLLNIDTTGLTGTNTLYVRGLPFVSRSDNQTVGAVATSGITYDGSDTSISCTCAPSDSWIRFWTSGSGTVGPNNTQVVDVASETADIYFTITYFTA